MRTKGRKTQRDLAVAYLGAPSVDTLRVARVVDAHIDRVLEATDGNLSLTAELLGMHRRSLQRVLRRRARRPRGRR